MIFSKLLAVFISVGLLLSCCQFAMADEPAEQVVSRKILFKYPNKTDIYVYYEGNSKPIAAVQGKERVVSQQVEQPDIQKVTLLISAHCLMVTANDYRAKGNFAEAEKHYKMAIDVAYKASSNNEIADLAELRLAGLYLKMSKNAAAEELYKHWLEKVGTNEASGSNYAAILDNLAQALTAQHKLDEAEKYNRQSTEIYRTISPEPWIDIAGCLNSLAHIQIEQHKCVEAEATIRESIKITEQIGDIRGRAIRYDTLASTYYCRHLFREALQAHQKALGFIQQAFGPTHPETAICLGNIAHCYIEMHDWTNAVNYLQRAMKITLDSEGGSGPNFRSLARELDLCLGKKLLNRN